MPTEPRPLTSKQLLQGKRPAPASLGHMLTPYDVTHGHDESVPPGETPCP